MPQKLERAYLTIIVKNKKDTRFSDAKRKEVIYLVNRRTYEFVQEDKILEGSVILQSRFVLPMKNFNEPDELYKTVLVILGHIDPENRELLTRCQQYFHLVLEWH